MLLNIGVATNTKLPINSFNWQDYFLNISLTDVKFSYKWPPCTVVVLISVNDYDNDDMTNSWSNITSIREHRNQRRTHAVPADSSVAELNLSRRFFPDGEVLEDEAGRRWGDEVGAL